tara:strand:- start:1044 stop:1904 length:861 start_codon:yes stop_codon:yes gene_type:complete
MAISSMLPPSWRPKWNLLRLACEFRGPGRSLRYDQSLASWVATKPVDGKPMSFVVRSYRELRRFRNFGIDPSADLTYRWLRGASNCKVFYDVGASIGIYGIGAHVIHGAKSVFVEPYAPSIETLLKSISLVGTPENFEVVQAGIDAVPSYGRLYIHNPPKPGVTKTSYSDLSNYTLGGRDTDPVHASQWLPGVSLDQLIFEYGLPRPTHVKIDVDGFEVNAMKGATRLLQERSASSFCIETNGNENLQAIEGLMADAGYKEIDRQRHERHEYFIADVVYQRDNEVT